ncbi:RcnB family protein [Denitrificimonas caeni]|uniref:RcnB family protein n=1 Tax=Denitrificimonas caeni TaxID=521720 RepID=UPI0019654FB4|nr:RcnB family protein [Denitrificimonas caeni]
MLNIVRKLSFPFIMIGIMLSLLAGSAFADKPHWAQGNNRKGQEYRYEKNHNYRYNNDKHHNGRYGNDNRRDRPLRYGFYNNDRRLINQYYRDQHYQGKCPRGLAKKNNRCQPPGYAKKWKKGKHFTKHTQYYDLPKELRYRLSPPQDNYRYVRVDDDILMVDNVTNIIVDVIENILR